MTLSLLAAGVTAQGREDAALPEGFLEFMAEWENEQGEWQDPLAYEDPQWQALDEQAEQNDE